MNYPEMKYIIQKKVRSSNYFFSERTANWQGLKENATALTHSAAIGWKTFLQESYPEQTFEIIPYDRLEQLTTDAST
jgi:hypothetical protein